MVLKKLKKLLKAVAPVVAVVVAIVAPAVLPAIGTALGASGTAATAVGAAVVSGGATAAAGGTPEEILKSAAAAGLGTAAGGAASSAVKGAQQAGTLSGTVGGSSVLPAAAGGAAGAGTGTLVATGDVGKALGAAALGGVAGGGGELASSQAQQALPASAGRTTQALVAGGAGGATEAAIRGENPLLGAVLSAGQTAAQTKYLDAEAERLARQEQAIAAFSQPRSPGVGTQLGEATAELSGAVVPSTKQDIEETRRLGIELPETQQLRPALPEITVTAEREPISYVSPTGLARFTPTRTQPSQLAPSQVSERDRQMMEITGLTRAPKPTEDIGAPASDMGTTGAIGRPSVDIGTSTVDGRAGTTADTGMGTGSGGTGRVGTGGTGEGGEGEGGKAPKLTEADRRLISYLYGNIGAPMGTPFMGREMGAGTSALAQALSVGDPGALYLGKKGKERRPVWNVESLKLSDELGGTYG